MAMKGKPLSQVRRNLPFSEVMGDSQGEVKQVVRLQHAQVEPDPDQPRTTIDQEALQNLSATIKAEGQQSPIAVRYMGNNTYRIIFGERRWRAIGLFAGEYIDAVVIDKVEPGKILVAQLIENLQREDMTELDIAKSFQKLIDLGECKNGREVAALVGYSESTVSIYLKMLEAPEDIQSLVQEGIATIDKARLIVDIGKKDPEKASAIIKEAKETKTVARDMLREVKAQVTGKPSKPAKASADDKQQSSAGEIAKLPVTGEVATKLEKADTMPGEVVSAKGKEAQAKLEKERVKSQPQPATAIQISVALREDCKDFWDFGGKVNEFGAPYLAMDVVHQDASMAWVRFGKNQANMGEYACADLLIQGVAEAGQK
jgi:ParB family chromosome partitioning protein